MTLATNLSPRAVSNTNEPFNTKEKLRALLTDEIVIALCGPIGSPLHDVAEKMNDMLQRDFKYESSIIRLSNFIRKFSFQSTKSDQPEDFFTKINTLISKGNELRELYGASILAELAVDEIRMKRGDIKESTSPKRRCHIIDSIKNQEELDLLRDVYRDMLYTVGVFCSLENREKRLKESGLDNGKIGLLIDRDSGEEIKHGQTVIDTFPQADFFLQIDSGTDAQIKEKVERFINLILGKNIVTPTAQEIAMHAAGSAAANSACLSRQVGAALTNANGELLSVGWNDVPKAGGNLYTFDPLDPQGRRDQRCWNRCGGYCSNDKEKNTLARLVSETLASANVISSNKIREAQSVIIGSKLKNLIEFSRSIHAEMHAILNAGKLNGSQIQGGKLFITTYPCHSCARHIIAAGISEVYYIEPYKKSLAVKLHGDAITEQYQNNEGLVKILPYEGVAPSKFLSLFKMVENSRKSAGEMIKKEQAEVSPRFEKSLEAVPTLEGLVVAGLIKKKLIDSGDADVE